jgi:hypothetical protein
MGSGEESELPDDLDEACEFALAALADAFVDIAWQTGLEPRAIAMELPKAVPSGKAWEAEYEERKRQRMPRLGPWTLMVKRPSTVRGFGLGALSSARRS